MNRAYIRLVSGYVILIAAVFLVLGIYLVRLINDFEHDTWRDHLVNDARLISAAIRADEGLLAPLAQESGATLALVGADGVVIDGDPVRDADTIADQPDVESALAGGIGETTFFNSELGRDEFAVAVPVDLADGTAAALLLTVPADEAPGTWTTLTRLTVGVLLISAIGIAAVSAFMPRVITQPLAELTGVARRVSRGNLDARADTETYDELSELADAFNEMTDELRRQLLAVEDERSRLEAILEHLNDGVLIVDPRGAVSLINRSAERLLGIDRQRALVRTYTEVIRDHELVELIRDSHRLYDPEGPLPSRFIELGLPRRAVQAFAYPIARADTELVIVILRDITELRRTETVRRDFVANVSHDLRTPIASLKALVETLLAGALEDETVARDFLSRMEVEVDDLARLVEELLELSRAESRRIDLHQIPADLGNVARRSVARLRPHIEPKQIRVELEIPDQLPAGYFDPERIEQVLVNLLHNAIKFSPDGGSIRLHVALLDEELRVSVTDSGPGIASDDLERIFERFYKADQSRANSGSGLGLAIARHLVQLHGGRIWAESVHRGGATFTFTVPIATEEHARMLRSS